jgi:hypothetical protein
MGRSDTIVKDRTTVLLQALKIDPTSFNRFLEWVLTEHLILVLSRMKEIEGDFFSRPDALRLFRGLLRGHTGRRWSNEDLERIFERVKLAKGEHFRSEVPYEELLKVLWQIPWECSRCHKMPPEVTLHIDHVIPASVGGPSKRQNLQFLCARHNLEKSNRRAFEEPWLNLR